MAVILLADALAELGGFIEQAYASDVPEANTAILATADAASGRPFMRTVYVHTDDESVVFFVNALSGKDQQLSWDPQAALCFFWRQLRQQAIIEGGVDAMNDADAEGFWRRRPRDAALAIRVSDQKRAADKAGLQTRVREEKQQFDFVSVGRPPHWIGYRLHPDWIVFWGTGWQRMQLRKALQRRFDGTWEVLDQEP